MVDINAALQMASDGKSILECINQTIELKYNSVTLTFKITGIFDDEDETKTNAYIDDTALTNMYSSAGTTYTAKSGGAYNILYVRVKDVTYLDSVSDGIEDLSSEYKIVLADSDSSTVLDYIDLGTKVLTGIAMISLVVASIMIIIVQYVSIVERTKEIGILRSIGGRKKDISNLFMFESMILGTAGGILAVIVSYLIAGITNTICYISTGAFFISFNPIWYFIGFIIAVIVSILAGIAPSKKAGGLDPIECLRSGE